MRMLSTLAAAAMLLVPALGRAAPATPPPAFAACAVCHRTAAGAAPALGPNLWQVGGRVAGTLPGFAYSPAMKASKIVWKRTALIAFLTDPRKRVPGTRMMYAGQKDPKQAAAVAGYLLSLQ